MHFKVTANLHFLGFDLYDISETIEPANEQAAQDLFVERYRRIRTKQLPELLSEEKSRKVLENKPPNAMVLSCNNFRIESIKPKNPSDAVKGYINGYAETGSEEPIKFIVKGHTAIRADTLNFDHQEDNKTIETYRKLRRPLESSYSLS